MDIKSIISSTRLYNLHSHTQYCDGRATVAEMADAAAALGYLHYGFTPHSPLPLESPCNMKADSVAAYLDDVDTARRKHAGAGHPISFYAGMEIDYLGPQWGPSHPYFASLPLDYSIGSVHFIPAQDGTYVDIDGSFENFKRKMERHFGGDIEYVVDTFYSQSLAMVRAGGFDILGHFDKVGHNASDFCPGIEDSDFYRKAVERLVDLIEERHLTIELNTKAYCGHGRFFPGSRYLPRLVESGVTIVVNSDAHYPDRIDASRRDAYSLLDSLTAS